MRVLIAEDERASRVMLEATLRQLDYDVVATEDGAEALARLQNDRGPRLAVLDWMMPRMDGLEVCRQVRAQELSSYVYIILLTAKSQQDDLVTGLTAGADDYLTKPFDRNELRSRLAVGERILQLESRLATKVAELEHALGHVKQLQGLLPICMYCKSIRDDKDSWHRIESYIEQHSEVNFTH
nr:response regulator [Gammaproteobacteria bacterium]